MSDRDQFLKQVEKLEGSSVLHGSESLRKLLQYLAKHAVDHNGMPLKEYQIATEVFGRPADFDPQVDSTIRVQAGRLRSKLAEYYASEGAEDPILVELPKGAYALSFHHRTPGNGRKGAAQASNHAAPEAQPQPRGWIVACALLAILLAASIFVIYQRAGNRKEGEATASRHGEVVPAALQAFWYPFVSQSGDPWVIFSNAAFVGRPETGMRYFDTARDSGSVVWDHYTGVGEVLAVHSLDEAFGLLHRQLRVKRGSLFSLDDADNNNLIYVGSPSENLTLSEIPSTQEFVFRRIKSGSRSGDLAIVTEHPLAGESSTFLASPSGAPLTTDYAVIGLTRGLNPARAVLILAGTTTFGTQAAVEYVCRQDSLEDLLTHLGVTQPGELKPFEALLRVKIARGVPVETVLVAVRKR